MLRFVVLFFVSSEVLASYTLEDLVTTTLSSHSQMKIHASKEESALQGIENARNIYYPSISINHKKANASINDPNYFADDEVTTVRFNRPIYTGELFPASLREAKNNLELTQYQNKASQFQVVEQLITLYAELFNEYHTYTTYLKYRKIYKDIKNTLQNKVNVKLIATSEYNLLLEKLATLEYNINETRLNLDNLLQRVNILTGLNLLIEDIDFADTLDFYHLEFDTFYKAHYQVLQKHSEINILDAKYDIAKSKFMPKVDLSFEHQKGNFSNRNFGEENRVFIDFTYNFSFGDLGEADKTLIDKQTAIYELQSLKQELRTEFSEKYTRYGYLDDKSILMNKRITSLKHTLESKQRLFAHNKISWQDMLGSIESLVNLKNQHTELISQKILLGYYFYYLTTL